ncbi:MAG TPA: hypothetical protein V6D17_18765 [Candidatus Obscuribacterales bacterium]
MDRNASTRTSMVARLKDKEQLNNSSQGRHIMYDRSDLDRLNQMRKILENSARCSDEKHKRNQDSEYCPACNSQDSERRMAHWFLRGEQVFRPAWFISYQPYTPEPTRPSIERTSDIPVICETPLSSTEEIENSVTEEWSLPEGWGSCTTEEALYGVSSEGFIRLALSYAEQSEGAEPLVEQNAAIVVSASSNHKTHNQSSKGKDKKKRRGKRRK